jgi:hypothetical protein
MSTGSPGEGVDGTDNPGRSRRRRQLVPGAGSISRLSVSCCDSSSCRVGYRIRVRFRGTDQREQIRSACLAGTVLRGNNLSAADRLGHLRRHREAARRGSRRLHEYGGRSGWRRFIFDLRISG